MWRSQATLQRRYACSALSFEGAGEVGPVSRSIILSSASRAASVTSSDSFRSGRRRWLEFTSIHSSGAITTPAGLTGMPMVAMKWSGSSSLRTPGRLLSKRGQLPKAPARSLRTSTFTVTIAFISMAVPETSPSPWAQCTSPTESPHPSMKQGNSSVVPLTICFTAEGGLDLQTPQLDADGAGKPVQRQPNSREIARGREARPLDRGGAQLPVRDGGLGEDVAEEAETRDRHRVPEVV